MYKVKKDFTDLLKGNYNYKAGEAYEEKSPDWTKRLLETGRIEKVEIKNEVVQEKQK